MIEIIMRQNFLKQLKIKTLQDISQGKKVKMNENFIKLLIQKDKKNLFATYKGKIVSLGKLDGVFFIPKKVLLWGGKMSIKKEANQNQVD